MKPPGPSAPLRITVVEEHPAQEDEEDEDKDLFVLGVILTRVSMS